MGRAVIAMTAVRIRTLVEPGKVTDLSDIRPPTDVMAITSHPLSLRTRTNNEEQRTKNLRLRLRLFVQFKRIGPYLGMVSGEGKRSSRWPSVYSSRGTASSGQPIGRIRMILPGRTPSMIWVTLIWI